MRKSNKRVPELDDNGVRPTPFSMAARRWSAAVGSDHWNFARGVPVRKSDARRPTGACPDAIVSGRPLTRLVHNGPLPRTFYRVLPGFTGFYRVSLSFTGFYWVLPDFTGFYRLLPGFTGFYRVLPGFYRGSK